MTDIFLCFPILIFQLHDLFEGLLYPLNNIISIGGYDLKASSIVIFVLASFLTGFAKAGMKGTGLIIVPIMASIFGARASTGILLPMLIIADIMAVAYYRRNAQWKFILLLLPWTAIGIVLGLITGNKINENQFRIVLTTIVIVMLVVMILNDLRKKREGVIPDNRLFAAIMGIIGGFATMIGNSAGPVFTIYFLSMGMRKKEFIGTGAWFFLIINIAKVPLHVVFWETINRDTLMLSSITIPIIALGIGAGIWMVNLFPEKPYRYFVIAATLLSAIVMFI